MKRACLQAEALGWAGCQERAGAWAAAPPTRPSLRCSGPWDTGFPPPSLSSKPIVSQVTCGCVCNKPLSWLLEGLLSWAWRGAHLNTQGDWVHPSLPAGNSLGQRGPRGQASTLESRSTARLSAQL